LDGHGNDYIAVKKTLNAVSVRNAADAQLLEKLSRLVKWTEVVR